MDEANSTGNTGKAGIAFTRRGFHPDFTDKYVGFVSTMPYDAKKPHGEVVATRSSYENKSNP